MTKQKNHDQDRAEIDRIDADLVRLLADRFHAAERIGAAKGKGQPVRVRDPKREREVRERWRDEATKHGLPHALADRLVEQVLDHSRRLQEDGRRPTNDTGPRRVRVGYLGAPGAWSASAVQRFFETRKDQEALPIGLPSFPSLFSALDRREVEYVLTPVENGICGTVAEVAGALATGRYHIVGEEILPIHHVLAAVPSATLDTLRRVRSHPVALAQCTKWLAPWRTEPATDTTAAAETLAAEEDARVGVVCSERAARAAGLQVLARDIADAAPNLTRFLLIAQEPEPVAPALPAKTALLVHLDDKPGSLARFLMILAEADIDLAWLQSRPVPGSPGQYGFLLDFHGRADDPVVADALSRARLHCHVMKVLGTRVTRDGSDPATEA